MMTNLKKLTTLAALSALSLPALAESIDVRVIGTIKPAACTPSVSGNAVFDYGVIKPDTLSDDQFTVLDQKQADFSITCDAPAKIAVTATSGAGASAVNTDGSLDTVAQNRSVNLFGWYDMPIVGLGLDNKGNGIGGYAIRFAIASMKADGKSVDTLYSRGNTTNWSQASMASLYVPMDGVRYHSWAETGTLNPIPFTTVTGNLELQAFINKASNLDLTGPIELNGLTTIELHYL